MRGGVKMGITVKPKVLRVWGGRPLLSSSGTNFSQLISGTGHSDRSLPISSADIR